MFNVYCVNKVLRDRDNEPFGFDQGFHHESEAQEYCERVKNLGLNVYTQIREEEA